MTLGTDEDETTTAGRRSARSAVAYFAIAAVQRGSTLVLLPFFAASLTPAEFADIAVLTTVFALLVLGLSGGLETAVFRGVFTDVTPGRRSVASLSMILLVAPVAIGGTLAALADLAPDGFGVRSRDLALYLLAAGFTTAGTVAPFAVLRATERLRAYAAVALGYAALQTALRVVLVVMLGGGVRAWVVADLVAAAFVLVLGSAAQRPLLRRELFDRAAVHDGLRLGLPLLPHQMAHWGLNLSDRLILAALITPVAAGVYAMGYQVAMVAGLAVTELNRAFLPRYGEAAASASARARLPVFAARQILITTGLCGSVALVGPQAVHLLLPDSYAASAGYVPWAALGFLLLGYYYVPMNIVSMVAGRTDRIWIATLAAATVNVGANLALVPLFGAMAAAVNTAVGYGLLLAAVGALKRVRCPDVLLDFRRLAVPVLLLGMITALVLPLALRRSMTGLSAAAAGIVLLASLCAGSWNWLDKANGATHQRRAPLHA